MATSVHYFWVGPPGHHAFIGMDTAGPLLLREKIAQTPVYFWCLDEYVVYYERQFSEKEIAVIGIQNYLKLLLQQKENPAKANSPIIHHLAKLIQDLLDSALRQENRHNKCREYVTIKALMQYFAQINFSGYFLDTNVLPLETLHVVPAFNQFLAPFIPKFGFYDPWLMFSPANDTKSFQRFEYYFHAVWMEFNSRINNVINRDALGQAFVEATLRDNSFPENEEICYSPNSPYLIMHMPLLGFYKRYTNTHKENHLSSLLTCLCNEQLLYESEFLHYLRVSPLKPYTLISGRTLLQQVIYNQKEHLLDVMIKHLTEEDARKIFTKKTDLRFYCFNPNSQLLLFRFLTWYIEKRFKSPQHFLKTVAMVRAVIASKKCQNRAHGYYLRSHSPSISRIDELIAQMFQSSQQDNEDQNLVRAADLVTRLGPIDDDSIGNYVAELTQELIDIMITRSFFAKEYKKTVQRKILERLGYGDSQLTQLSPQLM